MNQKPILFISILLAFVAGFSDGTTFLGAGDNRTSSRLAQ